jgi:DNA (cytosine-5)-methyltransferase 1
MRWSNTSNSSGRFLKGKNNMPSFYEFFAGGGMARAGLGGEWTCLFANDVEPKKGASYIANWGTGHLAIEDVAKLSTKQLPGHADLAWASFPCQDLSLAGDGAGLKGERSGTFWPFWYLMKNLRKEGRAPKLIVLENVPGALSSHGGGDFASIGAALAQENYRFGAVMVDAVHFVPQSRPRLFIIGIQKHFKISADLCSPNHDLQWHPAHLIAAHNKLSRQAQAAWIWWRLPKPPARQSVLSDLIDDESEIAWHTPEQTRRLLALMAPNHRRKVQEAKQAGERKVGGIYKRMREDEDGERVQRAEVRFDDVSGCLRTPIGGSSRQSIIVIKDGIIRTRLLAPREAARLMGLPDGYVLPENYNEAYHLAGDGVVVPVVRFLAAKLLNPLLAKASFKNEMAEPGARYYDEQLALLR